MSTDDERAALAAGYALGSLTPKEKAQYEAYLAASPERQREADAFTAVSRMLAADTPQATPTPGLKQRLLAQVAATPQHAPTVKPTVEPTAANTEQAPGTTRPDVHAGARATTSGSGPASERATRRWFRRPLSLSVAAAVAALILFGGGLVLGTSIQPATRPSTAQADALAQLTTAPDVQRTTVPVSGGGNATLVWSATLARAAIITDEVAPAPAGKTYQLWFIRGSHARSAGLMTADNRQSWKVMAGRMQSGDTIGITIEPAGGSRQPTTKPIAIFTP